MRVLSILLTILFFATSCQNNKDQSLDLDSSVKQVFFFSEESEVANFQVEAPYYDAIIQLRQQFPKEFKNMKTLTPRNAKDHFDALDVKECPALVILHNEKILVKVDGESTKEEIIAPISAALNP